MDGVNLLAPVPAVAERRLSLTNSHSLDSNGDCSDRQIPPHVHSAWSVVLSFSVYRDWSFLAVLDLRVWQVIVLIIRAVAELADNGRLLRTPEVPVTFPQQNGTDISASPCLVYSRHFRHHASDWATAVCCH